MRQYLWSGIHGPASGIQNAPLISLMNADFGSQLRLATISTAILHIC